MEKGRQYKRRVILKHNESREIVCKTFHFLKAEFQFMKENNHDFCDLTPLATVGQRTCDATGIGRRTLSRYLKEEQTKITNKKEVKEEPGEENECEAVEDCGAASTSNNDQPQEKRKRLHQYDIKTSMEITSRLAKAMRSTMQNVKTKIKQKGNEKTPKLKALFSEIIGSDGSEKILRRTLLTMGYRWHVGDDGKRTIIEKHNTQIRRFRYLRDVIKFRSKNMNIVYTGAKVVYKNPRFGQCQTILWAGTHEGSLRNTFWINTAVVTPTLDREYNLNQQVYHKWLTQYLLPNLPNNCVVVVNDAPYNNEQCYIPTETVQLKEWLLNHNIQFDHGPFEDLHRMELLDLVMKNKEKFPAYKSDELISQQGHIVLRLPPRHPELNATEGVLEQIKTDVEQALEATVVKAKLVNFIESVAKNVKRCVWHEHCEMVKKVEAEYLEYYDNMEMDIQIHEDDNIIKNIKQEDDDSNSSDKESLQ